LIEEGVRLYQEAATKASSLSRPDLAAHAKQKMHLEVARQLIREGHTEEAVEDIELGLSIAQGRPCYTRDLEELRASLVSKPRQ